MSSLPRYDKYDGIIIQCYNVQINGTIIITYLTLGRMNHNNISRFICLFYKLYNGDCAVYFYKKRLPRAQQLSETDYNIMCIMRIDNANRLK